jgi:hypothetical protein
MVLFVMVLPVIRCMMIVGMLMVKLMSDGRGRGSD